MQRIKWPGEFLFVEQVMYRSKNPSPAAKHAHDVFGSIAKTFDEIRDCVYTIPVVAEIPVHDS
jgi:hypothetical protein